MEAPSLEGAFWHARLLAGQLANGFVCGRSHERVSEVAWRREGLLDGARADPPDQVQLRSGLVVRARGACASEWLLADDRAGRLVVDVEVAGRVAERCERLANWPLRSRANTAPVSA